MDITWLGQGGFLFESVGERLIIDPFLSDVVEQRQGFPRLTSPPFTVEELEPDFIFITHDHIDHFDPISLPEIHRSYPKVPVGGPDSVMNKAVNCHFNPSALVTINKYDTHFFGRFKITAMPATHSDPFTVGCLVEVGGKVIYLSGDTLYSEKLADELMLIIKTKIDVMLVCINGKLGNMDWLEAVSLVRKLKPKLAIPMHYGMFAENTTDPVPFIDGIGSFGIMGEILIPGVRKTIS